MVQSDSDNLSRLATVVALVVNSNTALATMPGNTFLPAATTGPPRDPFADVTALVTLDRADLGERVGSVPARLMDGVGRGLRRILDL